MKQINMDSFKQEIVDFRGVTFLAVETEWCEPCKKMADVVGLLEQTFSNEPVRFLSLDLDKNPALTAYYRMQGLPTVLLFHNGVIAETIMGIKMLDEYKKLISDLLHPEQKPKDSKGHVVKVFSTPTCPYCHMVKAYLKDKGIAFDDIDVSTDQQKAMEMVNRSGEMGVPQLWIDDKVVVGFNKPEINKLLNL